MGNAKFPGCKKSRQFCGVFAKILMSRWVYVTKCVVKFLVISIFLGKDG